MYHHFRCIARASRTRTSQNTSARGWPRLGGVSADRCVVKVRDTAVFVGFQSFQVVQKVPVPLLNNHNGKSSVCERGAVLGGTTRAEGSVFLTAATQDLWVPTLWGTQGPGVDAA